MFLVIRQCHKCKNVSDPEDEGCSFCEDFDELTPSKEDSDLDLQDNFLLKKLVEELLTQ